MASSEQSDSDIKPVLPIISTTAGPLSKQEGLFKKGGANSKPGCENIEMDTAYENHILIMPDISAPSSVQSDEPKIEMDTAYEDHTLHKTEGLMSGCEAAGQEVDLEDKVTVFAGSEIDSVCKNVKIAYFPYLCVTTHKY